MGSLSEGYANASHAFLLKDFIKTRNILQELEQEIQGLKAGDADNNEDYKDLSRKIWILEITLLASDTSSSTSATTRELELQQLYDRIQEYYTNNSAHGTNGADRVNGTLTHTPLHPSILVALSLAGLKLNLLNFTRRSLEGYFDELLLHHSSDSAQSSLGDSSLVNAEHSAYLDTSSADLSLSGVALPNRPQPDTNGDGHDGKLAAARTPGYTKSFNRLARIYAIHLLGRALNQWDEARIWISSQLYHSREEGEIVEFQLISDVTAKSLLIELQSAKEQQESEYQQRAIREQEQRFAESEQQRKRKEQEEIAKKAQKLREQEESERKSKASSANGSKSRRIPSGGSNGSESGKRRTGATKEGTASAARSDASLQQPPAPQTTGFASLRSHLSSFLANSSQSLTSQGNSSGSLSAQDTSSTLALLKVYIKRLAASRLVSTMLVFWLILRFWKRRAAQLGRTRRGDVSKAWETVRDKVVSTVKMGGSLGYL